MSPATGVGTVGMTDKQRKMLGFGLFAGAWIVGVINSKYYENVSLIGAIIFVIGIVGFIMWGFWPDKSSK